MEESRWLAYDFNQLDTLVYNADKLKKVSLHYRSVDRFTEALMRIVD